MKRTRSNVPNPDIRILKVSSCSSLSGKSTLTYQVGCNAESNICFRVTDNTGGGFFNDEWVAFDAIQQAFDNQPKSRPIVSHILLALFEGRSLNSPAFLLAVLQAEGLVKPLGEKKRGYERTDPAEFMAEIKKRMSSHANAKGDEGRVAVSSPQSAKRGGKAKASSEKATEPTN